jgi:hypothetical protein
MRGEVSSTGRAGPPGGKARHAAARTANAGAAGVGVAAGADRHGDGGFEGWGR